MGLHSEIEKTLPENISLGYDNQKIILLNYYENRYYICYSCPFIGPFECYIIKRQEKIS